MSQWPTTIRLGEDLRLLVTDRQVLPSHVIGS
jgi:hypothetical protein